MKSLLLALILTAGASAEVRVREASFSPGATPAGWTIWSPRPEIAPRGYVDPAHARSQGASLALSGNSNPAVFGGWEYKAAGVEAGKWYRFSASYRAEGLRYEPLQVVSRLDWVKANGRRAGHPEYVYAMRQDGEWKQISVEAPAPAEAVAVKIQLFLQNAPEATVWFDDIQLDGIAAPGPRAVKVAAVNLRPGQTAGPAESVAAFMAMVDRTVSGADVILLPEGITVVGTGKKYADVAEPIPGPTTTKLAEMARKKNSYIVAGIYEREGQTIYNTAVMLDRTGKLAGKYRKVYIPREELEAGITPGSDYPVFATDFGKVGVMICWDLQYADPARALARRGAELILMPIWGGNETLAKARAIENRVFLASSGYDFPTQIYDPDGEILSVARERGTNATATIDLNKRYVHQWLGNMRGRFMKELRGDITY